MAEPDEYELTEDELNDWEFAYTPRQHSLSQNNMDFSRFSVRKFIMEEWLAIYYKIPLNSDTPSSHRAICVLKSANGNDVCM